MIKSRPQSTLLRRIEDHWIDGGLILLPLGMTISVVLQSDECLRVIGQTGNTTLQSRAVVVFFVLAAALVVVEIFHFCEKRSVRTLEDEILTLTDEKARLESDLETVLQDVRVFCDSIVRKLAIRRLDFGIKPVNSERITLYVHGDDGEFVPLGRFASNPEFESRGRSTYPRNEGCIARAWQDGWHFDCGAPDPTSDGNAYETYWGPFGMSRDTISRIRMKSRLYCGCSINGKDDRPIAVVVVESLDPTRWTEDKLRRVLDGEMVYLSEMLQVLKPHAPNASIARERGM